MQQVYRTRPPEGSQLSFLSIGILLCGFLAIGIGFVLIGQEIVGQLLSGWAAISLLLTLYHGAMFNYQWSLAATPIVLDEPEPAVETRTEYVGHVNTGGGQQITYSGIYLNDADMATLARDVLNNTPSVHRDRWNDLNLKWQIAGETCGVKSNVKNAGMTVYQYVLSRWGTGGVGWFAGTDLTPKGREHFSRFVNGASHPPTPPIMPGSARAQSAAASGDGGAA